MHSISSCFLTSYFRVLSVNYPNTLTCEWADMLIERVNTDKFSKGYSSGPWHYFVNFSDVEEGRLRHRGLLAGYRADPRFPPSPKVQDRQRGPFLSLWGSLHGVHPYSVFTSVRATPRPFNVMLQVCWDTEHGNILGMIRIPFFLHVSLQFLFLLIASRQGDLHVPSPPTHPVCVLLSGCVYFCIHKHRPEQGRARPAQQGRRHPSPRRGEELFHVRLPDTSPPQGR